MRKNPKKTTEVGNKPVLLSEANENYQIRLFTNTGSADVFFGGSDVTTDSDYKLSAGEDMAICESFPYGEINGAIYGITETGKTTVEVLECLYSNQEKKSDSSQVSVVANSPTTPECIGETTETCDAN